MLKPKDQPKKKEKDIIVSDGLYAIEDGDKKLKQDLSEEENKSNWITINNLNSRQYPPSLWCLNINSFDENCDISTQNMRAFMSK